MRGCGLSFLVTSNVIGRWVLNVDATLDSCRLIAVFFHGALRNSSALLVKRATNQYRSDPVIGMLDGPCSYNVSFPTFQDAPIFG